ncbi:phytoene desaturase family protein [Nocardia arthritidis]|uniref:NAD(P)-binding protein n=1 Tax=Nocardia arthritidis TaxID=228602 RepID=A0A6G9YK82_9NOCA|nr:NAD(P)/FAD-dependent oxidoreductase [Nocardia arthritidis]QIS13598.1 NAD(P)-binding protein [Nocardia arthritidis]
METVHPTESAHPNVVVIGAGIGGTALTLLLAHAGLRVTLLEKNNYLGGFCAGYEKQGFQIDFSTHLFTRGPKGPLGEVLRRTGHDGAIDFRSTHNLFELFYRASDGTVRSIPYPSQLHRLPVMGWKCMRALNLTPTDTVQACRLFTDITLMSPAKAATWNHRPLDEYISQFTRNPRSKALLFYIFTLAFVLPSWEMSAGEAIYCAQRALRDSSISYPAGGAKAIPLTYCRLARQLGAEIRTRAEVQRILVADNKVHGVQLADGSRVDADIVVSTSSLRSTALHLIEPGVLPSAYTDAAAKNKQSMSAVEVNVALKRRLVDSGCLIGAIGPGIALNTFDDNTERELVRELDNGRTPEIVFYYAPVPTNFDPSLAPPGHQLITACTHTPTTDIAWQNPPAEWEDALLRTLRTIIPGLDEEILFVDRTTSSWFEHWSGKEYGPLISTAQTPEQVGAKRPSITTPVDGLYIAGDAAGGRGVGTELAADSAMEAAETIIHSLDRALPRQWMTDRHALPPLRKTIELALRPTPVVHT